MPTNDDILSLLEEKGAQAAREAQRAVILQPGALGDCILTLPLVRLMKETLDLGGVDLVGHVEYVGILPERTFVDGIRSIDSTELHRLFTEPARFELADHDPLINMFADYAWIVSFLGEAGSDFEQNLIFTANCSHSAEIITLPLKPPEGTKQHISDFYVEQFAAESGLTAERRAGEETPVRIRVTEADRDAGVELLDHAGVDLSKRLVVIHPGSGGKGKCWHLDNFLSVTEQLHRRGFEVVLLLGPAEIERFRPAEKVHMHSVARCLAHLSLAQVVGLLACADAYLGNDSGVTHLAAALGLRTIAIFGPSDPDVYRPQGRAVTVLRDTSDAFADKPNHAMQQSVLSSVP